MPEGAQDIAADHSARPRHKVRFVTATSLFDGHDASINIMRRLLQQSGVEVVHLGHNRSVEDIVVAAIQEDVQGIAVSSYQGGHLEFFKYMVDLLRERGGAHIKVFGGGGGVIVASEISELHAYGVERIYSAEDGQRLGLEGMIADVVQRADFDVAAQLPAGLDGLDAPDRRVLARLITGIENGTASEGLLAAIAERAAARTVPAIGITGTGGAGKSSLTDELIRRFRLDRPEVSIAVVAVDPSRRRTGGALLGDRIRMNAVTGNIYMRSLATRSSGSEVPPHIPHVMRLCQAAGFDVVILETPGIGQADSAVAEITDLSLYVMTPEFGAASQLEKIEMLDHADLVAINKFDRRGGLDALRDVRKQMQRNRRAFGESVETMPVFGTIASRFADDGTTALYHGLLDALGAKGFATPPSHLPRPEARSSSIVTAIVPPARARYLAEIAETVRGYHGIVQQQAKLVREVQQLTEAARMLEEAGRPGGDLAELAAERERQVDRRARKLLDIWPKVKESYAGDEYVVKIRDRELRTRIVSTSLSGSRIPKVCLPPYRDHGELLTWLLKENLPGSFPYTSGVFAFKRENEDPTRMFAGEGDAFRTNARFKYLSKDQSATRLSTAFDSVTLYGCDPDERPDIYGKVGNSGVSIATLDDMKVLYSGFDLCAPSTSVSMTINGPAPIILAMFFNTADRPADRAVPGRKRPRADRRRDRQDPHLDPGDGTRDGAGRYPEGGPGAEHLHLLDRFRPEADGRHPGMVRAEPGAELLLGVDFRLPHRRGRGEPDLATRLHARQRIHLCRILPGPRHAYRRFRAQPVVLLFQRHGPRVFGDRPGRAAHLGGGDAVQVQRQRAVAEAEIPHPDLRSLAARPGERLQRHPHDAAGADRRLRQLQFLAHQRP